MKEHEIIGFLKKTPAGRDPSVIVGIGDDAAVVRPRAKELFVFTTDAVVENVHFTRDQASPYRIGRKAIAVNLSDIAAMGALPRYALVSLGLPTGNREFVKELYRGMRALAGRYGVAIIGGNIARSRDLFVDVFLVGTVQKKYLKLRSGAKPGDLICVTGTLGGTRRRKHLDFVPRVHEVQKLLRAVPVSAMMDISDGLSSDLTRMAEANRVGFRLFAERIPVSPDALKMSANRAEGLDHALNDGEDYELLFTVPGRCRVRIPKKILTTPVTVVGEMIRERKYYLASGRRDYPFRTGGFDHFAG